MLNSLLTKKINTKINVIYNQKGKRHENSILQWLCIAIAYRTEIQ